MSNTHIKAGMAVLLATTEAIREAGSVPRGHLYAMLMPKLQDYQAYESLERTLLNTGLVTRKGDLLTWTGPEVSA